MNKINDEKIRGWLCFKPFLKLIQQNRLLLFFDKKTKVSDEPEWSLDCSGQGECQPNISPSDGEEKLEFLKKETENKKKRQK